MSGPPEAREHPRGDRPDCAAVRVNPDKTSVPSRMVAFLMFAEQIVKPFLLWSSLLRFLDVCLHALRCGKHDGDNRGDVVWWGALQDISS